MRLPILPFLAALAAPIVLVPAVAEARPVVVELFTSEGCSSCPPADQFLTELAHQRHDLLPLAFHVTYWNSLGWRDPYSLEQATARQNDYARRFGSNSVFTPQMVIDGTHSVVGSDREAAADALRAASARSATGGALRLVRRGDRMVVSVGSGSGHGRVLLVGFDHEHRTAVGRGENSGRTLVESNIVRSVRAIGRWDGQAATFSEALPAGEASAVLLQGDDERIIGAARETGG